MKIPRNEAVLLPNKTYPIRDEPGYYIAELDVFHQLHCLVSPFSVVLFQLNGHNLFRTMFGVLLTEITM